MMSDLIERLRADQWASYATLRREAADALEAKDAEIARLRAALEYYSNPEIYPYSRVPQIIAERYTSVARNALNFNEEK